MRFFYSEVVKKNNNVFIFHATMTQCKIEIYIQNTEKNYHALYKLNSPNVGRVLQIFFFISYFFFFFCTLFIKKKDLVEKMSTILTSTHSLILKDFTEIKRL